LQDSKYILKYKKKMKTKPQLTHACKKQRLGFAEKHSKWLQKWRNVIFTDVEKFNLVGPNRWKYYYHDLQREERKIASCQQIDGASAVVWQLCVGIGYYEKTEIVFIPGKVNTKKFVDSIGEQIQVRAVHIAGGSFVH
jgi:hypothetical protein